jgi:hypothetical protein
MHRNTVWASSGWLPLNPRLADLLFDFDDLTALMIATILAYSMWQLHLAAVIADNQVQWLKLVVLAPAAASSLRQLALW